MPSYEYKCKRCGYKFDIEHCVFTSGNSIACPSCGGTKLEKTEITYRIKPSGEQSNLPPNPD